jgi:hypothetical protein
MHREGNHCGDLLEKGGSSCRESLWGVHGLGQVEKFLTCGRSKNQPNPTQPNSTCRDWIGLIRLGCRVKVIMSFLIKIFGLH